MQLKLLSIKNWQQIKNMDIYFENLMLFLGQSNEGVNSVTSALSFAFNKRELKTGDILSHYSFSKIKLIFYDNDFVYKLKILINKNNSISYSLKTNDNWKDITFDEYLEFINLVPFIHIRGKSGKDFKEVGSFFYKLLSTHPKKTKEITEHLDDYFHNISINHSDNEVYRYLFFEFIKKLTDECLDKTRTLLEQATILFEDPELYLHPQKERELYNYFIKLSNRGLNIYLKTYSSSFIGLKQYKSICIIRKENDNISIWQTNKDIFKDDDIKSFNMNYWINPDRAELFFAKKVILVEGQTDKVALSYLAKNLSIFKYDYSIIECGSKSIIPQFITLLNNFNIPYIAVYDKDNHSWRTKEEIENSNFKNKQIDSLINPKFGASLSFDNDIEEEIYNAQKNRIAYKNKPFNALKYISEENFHITPSFVKKIEKIYE